jgi:hypothetical protein
MLLNAVGLENFMLDYAKTEVITQIFNCENFRDFLKNL